VDLVFARTRAGREDQLAAWKINLGRRGRINLAVNADHATFGGALAPRNRWWEAS
jgi:hypothetical protein